MDSTVGAGDQDGVRYFLGIGAQKAGSTWLHKQLDLHPQVALPPRKEVHYFDTMHPTRYDESAGVVLAQRLRTVLSQGRNTAAVQIAEQFEVFFRGPSAYKDYIGSRRTPATRVIGDVTPGYADLTAEGFAAAKDLLDPRLIYVMRDPLDRYWSWARMTAGADTEQLTSLYQKGVLAARVWSRCDYEAVLRTLDDTFDSSDVLVLFYEDMFDERVLSEIGRFLGIEPTWPWDIEARWNVAESRALPDPPAQVLERLEPVYSYVRSRFGNRVPASWRH